MKKIILMLLALVISVSFYACSKTENKADVSLKEGETKITGTVEQVNSSILIISDGKGGRYSFCLSDEVEVVEDGYYVVDLSADSFKGKKVTAICSSEIMETYPAMLKNERILIIE